MSKQEDIQMSRDVATAVTTFVEFRYGENCHSDLAVLEGLWLAMQMIGGPGPAAVALRYCGVNFELR